MLDEKLGMADTMAGRNRAPVVTPQALGWSFHRGPSEAPSSANVPVVPN
jgi:hypothetical protein